MATSFYDRIDQNKRNSYIMIAAVFAICITASWVFFFLLFGNSFLAALFGFAFAAVYVAITYLKADKIILSISGAREARKEEHPYLVNVVEGLSIAAGIPAPKIYLIDDGAPNAFAVGLSPENSSVVFTTGLLSTMNRAELEGVAAHEISHIKNFDSRLATLTVAMVGLIAIISDLGIRGMFFSRRSGGRSGGGGIIYLIGLLILLMAPIFANLVRLALSREREFLADAYGAKLTRYPEGLASALEKIKNSEKTVLKATEATASLYFANPLSIRGLFATHPPIEERIRRLRQM